jgi:hypothetical protein
MNRILMFMALGEAGMGVILLAYPPIVVRVLFDAEIVGAGVIMSRLAGIALIGLGVACWPGPPRAGMLIYSVAAALYLACVGLAGGFTGILLWPAVILHLIVTALLFRASTGLPDLEVPGQGSG